MPENCIGLILFYFFFRFQLNINLRMYRIKPCEVKKEQILWKTSESCTAIGLIKGWHHTVLTSQSGQILLNICGTIIENVNGL